MANRALPLFVTTAPRSGAQPVGLNGVPYRGRMPAVASCGQHAVCRGRKMSNSLLADAVLIIHFAIVLFIVLGLPAIWAGALQGWLWVRNVGFRVTHFFAIVLVALEAVAGLWCPLTVLEDALRGGAPAHSFVARWVHSLLFYQFEPWVFTLAYVVFAALVGLTLVLVPPLRSRAEN